MRRFACVSVLFRSRSLGGAMVGSEAFWNARAKDDAPCDGPAHPPKSDDELFLEAVDAVVGGTDAEAAAACRALPAPAPGETAVASREIWTPWADDYPPTNRANETAATRLGLSHQRFAPALVVPLAREPKPEFHLLHAGVPELSGLMTVPGNTLLHVAAARGLVASDIHLTSKPSSDPYVVVLRDGVEVHRTKTVKKNLNPTYDDTFEVDLSPRTSRLRFLVFDYDRLTADDAMGEVNIDVADVEDAELGGLHDLHGRAATTTTLAGRPGCGERRDSSILLHRRLRRPRWPG